MTVAVRVGSKDVERAARLAEAMEANLETSVLGAPWDVEEVLSIALGRGLAVLEQVYLKATVGGD